MRAFSKVYHPYFLWEEIKFNMWGKVDDKSAYLSKAIEFTGDWDLYGSWMIKVVNDWPISCENSLTDMSMNRRAWIGHAAVAYAIQCPEDIVRLAWGKLTDEQRILANGKADKAIKLWERMYIKDKGLRGFVDQPLLF